MHALRSHPRALLSGFAGFFLLGSIVLAGGAAATSDPSVQTDHYGYRTTTTEDCETTTTTKPTTSTSHATTTTEATTTTTQATTTTTQPTTTTTKHVTTTITDPPTTTTVKVLETTIVNTTTTKVQVAGATLAQTGANTGTLLALSALFLTVGLGLVYAVRRKTA